MNEMEAGMDDLLESALFSGSDRVRWDGNRLREEDMLERLRDDMYMLITGDKVMRMFAIGMLADEVLFSNFYFQQLFFLYLSDLLLS